MANHCFRTSRSHHRALVVRGSAVYAATSNKIVTSGSHRRRPRVNRLRLQMLLARAVEHDSQPH